MKSVRFDRLLASTALGLVLVLSSHAGMAQQSDQQAAPAATVPTPDTTLPPPLTAKDVAPPAQIAPNAPLAPAAMDAVKETPKAAAVAPAPVTVVTDNAISDRLREMAGKLDRSISRKADREGVEAYYKSHNYAPIWVSNGAGNDRAKSAIAYLAQADAVGLDPADYPTADFKSATVDALADAELKLTAAALTFARQAQIGRVHFSRVSADIQFDLKAPEAADVLAKLADGSDAGKVLDSYNPPMPEFKALREKLAELRKNGGVIGKAEVKATPHVMVPEGKALKPGMKDERVVAVRKRLDIAGDKNNELYDNDVRQAVRGFQKSAGMNADGNLGANTVKAMNGEKKESSARGSSHDPIDTIIVNMERWRWYARDLGNPHVVVNIPDYTLTLFNDGKQYWKTKIVAGKPTQATPLISAEMKFITVNPTWNVPPSIIEKEYLPALQEDPQALERIGLKLEQAADGTVRIYQPPGAANALGRIRFNFPNKFLVYQHDTPDKNLFAREERAFSHGCMRVQNPLMYGEKLLSLAMPNEHYTEAKLQSMFGGSEININFPKNIWVHLTYQTAFVDDEGKLQLRKDIYGRDAKMIQILKGSERKVADIAVERAPNSSSKPVRMPVGMYGGGGYNGGPNFFDFLFGGGQAQQPASGYRGRNFIGPPSRTPNGRVSSR